MLYKIRNKNTGHIFYTETEGRHLIPRLLNEDGMYEWEECILMSPEDLVMYLISRSLLTMKEAPKEQAPNPAPKEQAPTGESG